MQKIFSKLKAQNLAIAAFILIFAVNFLLKVPIASMGFFAFTYDQGRDFLAVSKIVDDKKLMLIGATTGQPGIFYGPTWYYFLVPIYAFSGGDPQKVALFFSFFGIITTISIYLFIKANSKSFLFAFLLGLIASFSYDWMLGPVNIWNTGAAPILTLAVFYLTTKILKAPQKLYFFLLGISLALIFESEVPWGIIMLISTLTYSLFLRHNFFKKDYLFSAFGLALVFLPKALFELKHDFLEIRSAIAYIHEPKFYNEQSNIGVRFLEKLDLFWNSFSSEFAKGNKNLGLAIFIALVLFTVLLLTNKKNKSDIKKDNLTIFCTIVIGVSLFLFTLFKDTVWQYYLIGIPVTFLILISRIFDLAESRKATKFVGFTILSVVLALNFNPQIFYPYKISWLGDGVTYRNEKQVMDYIASKNPRNYSLYAYSPAFFDYPFDYLTYWYTKRGIIEKPVDNSNVFYLIIRDFSTNRYLAVGWYGDKTKNKTKVIDRKEFIGDVVVEKHERI